ncbi:hypothetical protein [Ciceribacter sp. L1K22]|uniref:hypothetical protein n=1 Tax=Ciceribacter sp. L1K22 TaxID=2820275 RepID=UPI001ABE78C9|nr:hypothetical protein [Ciceribacter sp. L1K22]MBO3760680.1 hypothetical protein [Ciceribacter sp. L1K22]
MALRCLLIAFGLMLWGVGTAGANNFYVGTWTYKGCTLHLKGGDILGNLQAETNFCSGDWAFVTQWRMSGDLVDLRTVLDKSVARLKPSGGDLVTYLSSGAEIRFKRTTPAPAGAAPRVAGSGSVPVGAREAFVRGVSCVKRGSGDSCATDYELGLPTSLPRNSTAYTKPVNVTVLTGLNFRAKIGFDQPVHFSIPAGSCVPIWACFDTNGTGPWCVTRVNGKQGYLAMFSKRSSGEMQVNYTTGCAG